MLVTAGSGPHVRPCFQQLGILFVVGQIVAGQTFEDGRQQSNRFAVARLGPPQSCQIERGLQFEVLCDVTLESAAGRPRVLAAVPRQDAVARRLDRYPGSG